MASLDIENIKIQFYALSSLDAKSGIKYIPLIKQAKTYVESLIRDDLRDKESELCEYAAATVAFYDYTVALMTSVKSVKTQTGIETTRYVGFETYDSAKELRDNALNRIKGFFKRVDDFVFCSIDG